MDREHRAVSRRVDPQSGRRVADAVVGNRGGGVTVGAGAVWVSDDLDGTLTRIDPEIDGVAPSIALGQSASGVAAGERSPGSRSRSRTVSSGSTPARTPSRTFVRVAGGPAAVAIGAGAEVGHEPPRRNRHAHRSGHRERHRHHPARRQPAGVAVVDGNVWVALQSAPRPPAGAPRGAADTLRVVRPQVLFGGTDPLHAANSRDVQYATCALLFNHPDQPFPAGTQLQPEVAAAMPTVPATAGGPTASACAPVSASHLPPTRR